MRTGFSFLRTGFTGTCLCAGGLLLAQCAWLERQVLAEAAALWAPPPRELVPVVADFHEPMSDATMSGGLIETAPLRIARADAGTVPDWFAAAMRQDAAAEAEAAESEESKEEGPPRWKSTLEAAVGASFGNTDNQTFRAAFTTKLEKPFSVTSFDTSWYYAATDGDKTDNRYTAGLRQDWILKSNPRWLIFAQIRYDYDEFQSWQHRVAAHGGVGYKLVDKEDFTFTPRIGLGAKKEWGSDNDSISPEALAGFDLLWKISEKQRFEMGAYLYPDLGNLSEFRTVTTAKWTMMIDEKTKTAINAGVTHEYQSETDPGKKHYDLKMFVGLQVSF